MRFLTGIDWLRLRKAAGDEAEYFVPAVETSSPKVLCNIKGIILDFDGTIFDNTRIAVNLIASYFPDMIRIRNERFVRKHFTGCDYSTPEEYYNTFFSALGKLCFCSPQRIRNWYFNRYMPRMVRVLRKHYKPREGFTELFRLMGASAEITTGNLKRANFPQVAVYSDYPMIKERLEALGLHPSKRIKLYGPDSFGAQKPAVRPFRRIAEDFGLQPEEILVIGDRDDTDGLGAFRAGMRFFCLKTGQKRYFRLDPYRRHEKEEPHGPFLAMYAGTWDDLYKLLIGKFS